jgi:hypothetical protein
MKPDEIATQADNKVARAPDPELDDEVYPLGPPQEAETGVPECEQIDEEAEQARESDTNGTTKPRTTRKLAFF